MNSEAERHARLADRFAALADADAATRDAALAAEAQRSPTFARALAQLLGHDPLASAPRLGPYRLQEIIGQGGAGVVYRAIHGADGDPVAIKRLHPALAADAAAARRFRREARALARLSHPFCVAILAEGQAVDGPWFAMEYHPLGALPALADAPLVDRLIAGAQLALALDAVHGVGLVHRDVKPSNVLTAARDPVHVKLADFGIARAADASAQLTVGGGVVGTPDFLAPELLSGHVADARSDLYALGCTLYWLFAGRLPFEGGLLARLHARAQGEAPPLDGPARAVVAQLLAADPRARPPGAHAVAVALHTCVAALDPAAADALARHMPASGAPVIHAAPLVGRADLMARLRAWAAGDAPSKLGLTGPAGVGLTTILNTVEADAARDGQRVIRICPQPGAGSLAPWRALLDGLGVPQPAPEAEDAPARWAQAVRSALPEGALVLVEDLHLFEPGDLAVLGVVLQGGARVLISGRAVFDAADVLTIEVPPLPDAAIAEMLRAMLATTTLPVGLLALIQTESGGIPLQVGPQLHALVTAGALRRTADGWAFDGDAPDVTHALRRRLDELPPTARAILRCAAVLGPRVEFDPLKAVAEASTEAVLDALHDAIRAGVLHEEVAREGGRGALRFRHDRFIELLQAELTPSAAAAVHRRAWQTLRGQASAAALARHAVGAGDALPARAALLAAADEAWRAPDPAAAARFISAALEIDDPAAASTQTHALRERLADAWTASDGAQQGADAYAALLRGAPTSDRPRLLRKRGRALLRAGQTTPGKAALEACLVATGRRPLTGRLSAWIAIAGALLGRRAASTDPRWIERAHAHRELALWSRYTDLERCAAHALACRRAARRANLTGVYAEALGWTASMWAFTGRLSRATTLLAQAERDAPDDDLAGRARLAMLRGGVGFLSGDFATTERSMRAAAEMAARAGDRFVGGLGACMRGWSTGLLGAWAAAVPHFERAQTLAEAIAVPWLAADARCGLCLAHLVSGDLERATALAAQCQAAGDRLGLPAISAMATEARAWLLGLQGAHAEGLALIEIARQTYRRHRLGRAWGYSVEVVRVELLLGYAEDAGADAVPDLARRLRQSARCLKRGTGRFPLFAGLPALVRGIAAARSGHRRRALRWFARAERLRPPHVASMWDHWLIARATMERYRLGASRRGALDRLGQVDAALRAMGAAGFADGILQTRARVGLTPAASAAAR